MSTTRAQAKWMSAKARSLQAEVYRTEAEVYRLEGAFEQAERMEYLAVEHDRMANEYRETAKRLEKSS